MDVEAKKASGLTPTQENVLPADDIRAFITSMPYIYLRPFTHNTHLHLLQSLLKSLLTIP